MDDDTNKIHPATTSTSTTTTVLPPSPTFAQYLEHVYDHVVTSYLEFEQGNEATTTTIKSSPFYYHIVVGNQAGDCDSIISALTYAYIQQQQQQHQKNTLLRSSSSTSSNLITPTDHPQEHSTNNKDKNITYIPLIPFPREDMILRRDATLLLSRCGISNFNKLLFVNDSIVTNYMLIPERLTAITLVDHNKLQSNPYLKDSYLSNYVVEILDHHLDEGEHSTTVTNRNIAFHDGFPTVGSCCTLVGETLMQFYYIMETRKVSS